MNPTVFLNLVLPNHFENKNKSKNIDDLKLLKNKKRKFNKNSYLWMLKNLRKFIFKLQNSKEKSFWKNYDVDNTYDQNQLHFFHLHSDSLPKIHQCCNLDHKVFEVYVFLQILQQSFFLF